MYALVTAPSIQTHQQWETLFDALLSDPVLAVVFGAAVNASEFLQHNKRWLNGRQTLIDFDVPDLDTALLALESACTAASLPYSGTEAIVRFIEYTTANLLPGTTITQWAAEDRIVAIDRAQGALFLSTPWKAGGTLRGDITFNAANLPVPAAYWYGRFLNGITNATQNEYNPAAAGASGDSYLIARALGNCMLPALLAFRLTGDLSILTTIDAWWWGAYQTLDYGDVGGGGASANYLGWRDLTDDNVYGQQNTMNKCFAYSHVLEWAYVLRQNLDLLSAEINNHYAAWMTFITDHLLPDFHHLRDDLHWYYVAELAHTLVQGMRFFYYAYKLTGNGDYLARFEAHKAYWLNMLVRRADGSYVWDHNVIELRRVNDPNSQPPFTESMGLQSTLYANYTVQGLIDLACEGIYPLCLSSHMAGYTHTARVIFANGLDGFAGDVGGGVVLDGESFSPPTENPQPRLKLDTVSWMVTQAWRMDDTLIDLMETERAIYDAGTHIQVPASMVFAYLRETGRD